MPAIPKHIPSGTPNLFTPPVALGVLAVPLDSDAAVAFPVEEDDVAEPGEVAEAREVVEPREVTEPGEVAEPREVLAEPVEAVVFGILRLVPVPMPTPVAVKISVLVGVPLGTRLSNEVQADDQYTDT